MAVSSCLPTFFCARILRDWDLSHQRPLLSQRPQVGTASSPTLARSILKDMNSKGFYISAFELGMSCCEEDINIRNDLSNQWTYQAMPFISPEDHALYSLTHRSCRQAWASLPRVLWRCSRLDDACAFVRTRTNLMDFLWSEGKAALKNDLFTGKLPCLTPSPWHAL
jgi:hypothetical protein